VFKFLSGAAFAGSVANGYLWLSGMSVPFVGYQISPTLLGWRAVLQFALFMVLGYFGWFHMTLQPIHDDISRLRRHLEQLLAVSDSIFSRRIPFDDANHLAFMAILFAGRQAEHVRSVLTLDKSIDAVLITRSMFEGLAQLLWAAQAPDERPLRFRTFAFVCDWRTMRKQVAAGSVVSPDQRTYIEEGIRLHGHQFISAKARKAEAKGAPMPDDPYMLNWYGEKEKEIFDAVSGELAYRELYGPFSEWHHWRIGGFGFVLKFDASTHTFLAAGENPSLTATALASAWQCLWQTLKALDEIASVGIGTDLQRLYDNYVTIRRP
jgi:hypothetical protein